MEIFTYAKCDQCKEKIMVSNDIKERESDLEDKFWFCFCCEDMEICDNCFEVCDICKNSVCHDCINDKDLCHNCQNKENDDQ